MMEFNFHIKMLILRVNYIFEIVSELVPRHLVRQQGSGHAGLRRGDNEGCGQQQPPHRPQLRLRFGGIGDPKI